MDPKSNDCPYVRQRFETQRGTQGESHMKTNAESGKPRSDKVSEVPPEEKPGERSMELILPLDLQNGPTLIDFRLLALSFRTERE